MNHARNLRLYYYFLLGAFGGLTAWLVHSLAFRGMDDLSVITLGIRGTVLGGLIGVSIAAYDALIGRAARRFLKLCGYGLLFGVLAGLLALPIAQYVFARLWPASVASAGGAFSLQSFFIGTLCWAILGGIIGFVEVIFKGTESYKGLLGGVAGGIVGGFIYEGFRPYGQTASADPSQAIPAMSLAVMGGCIGLSIALISTLLRRAWIEVLDGKLTGYEYDVTKYVSRERGGKGVQGLIGADQLRANIYLPGDKGVLGQHAILCYQNEAPTIVATTEAQKVDAKTLVNGYPVSNWPLADGDEIKIGTTRLRYHQSRKRRAD